jgi:hypothetical protein
MGESIRQFAWPQFSSRLAGRFFYFYSFRCRRAPISSSMPVHAPLGSTWMLGLVLEDLEVVAVVPSR